EPAQADGVASALERRALVDQARLGLAAAEIDHAQALLIERDEQAPRRAGARAHTKRDPRFLRRELPKVVARLAREEAREALVGPACAHPIVERAELEGAVDVAHRRPEVDEGAAVAQAALRHFVEGPQHQRAVRRRAGGLGARSDLGLLLRGRVLLTAGEQRGARRQKRERAARAPCARASDAAARGAHRAAAAVRTLSNVR